MIYVFQYLKISLFPIPYSDGFLFVSFCFEWKQIEQLPFWNILTLLKELMNDEGLYMKLINMSWDTLKVYIF